MASSPDPQAYPISSYNYLIVNTSANSDKGKNDTIGQYVIYSVTEGQRLAADLGYSPLPPNLVQQAFDAVATVPGAPAPPPLGEWGKYYLQLGVQAAVGADKAAVAKKAAAAKSAAAAAGTGAAAGGTKSGTKKSGSSSVGGGTAGTTGGPTAEGGAATDPGAAAVDASGAPVDESVAPESSTSGQITNSSNQLQPDDPQLVAIAQPAPVSRLPFGLAMLVLVFVPPAVMAFGRRKKAIL